MPQEEKQLLIQDLCARMPYGVICQYDCVAAYGTMSISKTHAQDKLKGIVPLSNGHIGFMVGIDKIDALEGNIKPYLRPMSSMTESEYASFSNILHKWFDDELFTLTEEPFIEYALSVIGYSVNPILFDWLNEHHFDYRGLIEKGLALEAPEGMYNIKNDL